MLARSHAIGHRDDHPCLADVPMTVYFVSQAPQHDVVRLCMAVVLHDNGSLQAQLRRRIACGMTPVNTYLINGLHAQAAGTFLVAGVVDLAHHAAHVDHSLLLLKATGEHAVRMEHTALV